MPAPHDHAKWKENREKIREKIKKKKEAKASGTPLSSSSSNGTKLALNDNLKAVLFKNCGMSESQIQDVFDAHNTYKPKNGVFRMALFIPANCWSFISKSKAP
eukprot:3486413-Ditylum_brightwellii.AAC.1